MEKLLNKRYNNLIGKIFTAFSVVESNCVEFINNKLLEKDNAFLIEFCFGVDKSHNIKLYVEYDEVCFTYSINGEIKYENFFENNDICFLLICKFFFNNDSVIVAILIHIYSLSNDEKLRIMNHNIKLTDDNTMAVLLKFHYNKNRVSLIKYMFTNDDKVSFSYFPDDVKYDLTLEQTLKQIDELSEDIIT